MFRLSQKQQITTYLKGWRAVSAQARRSQTQPQTSHFYHDRSSSWASSTRAYAATNPHQMPSTAILDINNATYEEEKVQEELDFVKRNPSLR